MWDSNIAKIKKKETNISNVFYEDKCLQINMKIY